MTFQVDNGSATTTTPHNHLVEGQTPYPLNKLPTLTSATHHTIQSHGKGGIRFESTTDKHERFIFKVMPGIFHNIVSPAEHMEANKDKYWGYVIGVDTPDSSSTLVFKSNHGKQSDDRYKVQQEDTVISGIYRNIFQYVTMPIVSHLQTHKSLQDRVSVITDSRQLVMPITSEVAS